MKKIASLILCLVLAFSFPLTAFAEDNTVTPTQAPASKLTPEEQAARDAFRDQYLDKFTKLTDLRAQTAAARAANAALEQQIMDKIKSDLGGISKEQIAQLKQTAQGNKDLVAQAKSLNEQRKTLMGQFRTAVKNRDVASAQSLKPQILDITSQINDIRSKVMSSRDEAAPVREQLKAAKDKIKQLKDSIKSLQEQNKALVAKIKDEEKSKAQLWETYKSQIKSKDYKGAADTLDKILTAKANILTDIKARGEILKQILNVLG